MNLQKIIIVSLVIFSISACNVTKNLSTPGVENTAKIEATQTTSPYHAAMEKHIKMLEQEGHTIASYQQLCATFERIANTETDQWLPLYYASMGYISMAFQEKDLDKVDEWGEKALITIAKMNERNPVKSEVLVLQAMLSYALIKVDLMSRGMEYSRRAQQFLIEASDLNDNNPRVELLIAQSFFKAPPQFGRNIEKGCEHNAKALKILAEEEKENAQNDQYDITPHWGKLEALSNQKYCQ